MAKKPAIEDIPAKLYKILEPLEPDERHRAISAALTLFSGQAEVTPPAAIPTFPGPQPPPGRVPQEGQAKYFDSKQPASRSLNKVEQIAVAARFREQYEHQNTHTRDELEGVFRAARRNFDSHNFRRDMENAKKAGFFTRGGENTLAYYGQQYVDALPNLEAVKALRRPKKKGRKRKTSSKRKR